MKLVRAQAVRKVRAADYLETGARAVGTTALGYGTPSGTPSRPVMPQNPYTAGAFRTANG